MPEPANGNLIYTHIIAVKTMTKRTNDGFDDRNRNHTHRRDAHRNSQNDTNNNKTNNTTRNNKIKNVASRKSEYLR